MRSTAIRLSLLLSALLITGCGGGSSSTPDATPAQEQQQGPATVVTVTDDGNTSFDATALDNALAELSLDTLSEAERDGLLLMREEEKFAGDVYRYLYELWQKNIFDNIAASENTHTLAVKALLDRYELADPAVGKSPGEFSNLDLQVLYDTLTARGTPTLLDALYVGVLIEELDIADLERLKSELVANEDIRLVYDNLQKGSRNHLRAFYRQVLNSGGSYSPEYLSQAAFDEIVNSDTEQGADQI
jgi:hypothetical protein